MIHIDPDSHSLTPRRYRCSRLRPLPQPRVLRPKRPLHSLPEPHPRWPRIHALSIPPTALPRASSPPIQDPSKHPASPPTFQSLLLKSHLTNPSPKKQSYLVRHFQQGYGGTNLTQEVAHHSAHCFDYIRQALMCAGDTTLEGKTAAGPGWGSVHECVDYEALLEWANENSAEKWRNELMPGVSIL